MSWTIHPGASRLCPQFMYMDVSYIIAILDPLDVAFHPNPAVGIDIYSPLPDHVWEKHHPTGTQSHPVINVGHLGSGEGGLVVTSSLNQALHYPFINSSDASVWWPCL